MTTWRMRFECRIPNATDTHLEYVILIAFPLQKCLRNAPHCYVIHALPVFLTVSKLHAWKKNHRHRRSSIIPHILLRQVTFTFIIQLQSNFLHNNGFSYCAMICTITYVLLKKVKEVSQNLSPCVMLPHVSTRMDPSQNFIIKIKHNIIPYHNILNPL